MIELPIFGQSSASPEPCKGTLDDPAFGQDDETVSLIGAFDDFEVHALQSATQPFLGMWP